MNRQQLIETVISEIMKGVSRQVREIVREELDIEKKRLKRQLLEELSADYSDITRDSEVMRELKKQLPSPPQKKIDTGDQTINSILEEVRTDMEDMVPEMRFIPETTISDVTKNRTNRPVQPQQITEWNEDTAHKFNPAIHDPSQIDFSNIVEALEKTDRLPGERG